MSDVVINPVVEEDPESRTVRLTHPDSSGKTFEAPYSAYRDVWQHLGWTEVATAEQPDVAPNPPISNVPPPQTPTPGPARSGRQAADPNPA